MSLSLVHSCVASVHPRPSSGKPLQRARHPQLLERRVPTSRELAALRSVESVKLIWPRFAVHETAVLHRRSLVPTWSAESMPLEDSGELLASLSSGRIALIEMPVSL